MGDRANVEFRFTRKVNGEETTRSVYLYTHWSGEELPHLVHRALRANQGRWDDDEYLCRTVITTIVHSVEDCLRPTGWGVSPWPGDGEDRVLVLDMRYKTAWVESQTYGPVEAEEEWKASWEAWLHLPDAVGWARHE